METVFDTLNCKAAILQSKKSLNKLVANYQL
ncbi:hypothetical protein AB3538_01135 [Acinetobacter baumannii]